MKKSVNRFFCIFVATMLMGCGGNTAGTFTDEGRYEGVGTVLGDYVVTSEATDGSYIELDKDGDGYLYFATDNQGPISSWSNKDGKFTLEAGISGFTGTLKDGIMELNVGDTFIIILAQKKADISDLKIVSVDEYKKIMEESESESE